VVEAKVASPARLNRYKIPRIRISDPTSGILGEKYVQIDAGNLAGGVLDPGALIAGIDPGSLDRTLQRVEASPTPRALLPTPSSSAASPAPWKTSTAHSDWAT